MLSKGYPISGGLLEVFESSSPLKQAAMG